MRGRGAFHQLSVRLTAEESRDIKLILLSGIMHRRRAAMGVEPLGSRPPRIFRHGLGRPAFRVTGSRALLRTLELRRRPRWTRHRGCRRCFPFRPPAKTN